MKKNLMFLALATIGLASCNGGFKKAPGGLLYNINIDKSGPKIKEGPAMPGLLRVSGAACVSARASPLPLR